MRFPVPRSFAAFDPPFCPYRSCQHHQHPSCAGWWIRKGFHRTRSFGDVPRFKCRACKRSFSVQTFRVDYYAKRLLQYPALHELSSASMSVRALSRFFNVSCDTVLNKVDRLARQCLAAHASLRPLARADEAVCIDGFQSFDISQYFPNNITFSISSASLFVLEATHATLRRSGAMTARQKDRRTLIDQSMVYEKQPIERSFSQILDQIAKERTNVGHGRVSIVTDRKREYDRAFARHELVQLKADRFERVTVSSRAKRTRENPLFPVNYFDRQLRKDQAAHRRETACHSRSPSNNMSRFWCYAFFHNYNKRFRIKMSILDQRRHSDAAGIPARHCRNTLRRLYEARAFLSRTTLSKCAETAWRKGFPTPLFEKLNYLPDFALA